MATTTTRYVDTASVGGDGTTNGLSGATAAYASLNDCLVAEFAATPDLVASDIVLKVFCKGVAADTDGGGSIVEVLRFSLYQFTTDATRYLWILTDSADRHPGAYSESHYRLSIANGAAVVQNVDCKVVFEGIQFVNGRAPSSNPNGVAVLNNGTNADLILRECIVNLTSTTGTPGGGFAVGGSGSTARKLTVVNCVLQGKWYRGIQFTFVASGGKLIAYNNTVVGCYQNGILASSNAASTTYLKNNRIDTPVNSGGGGVCFSYGSTTLAGTGGNYSGDATSPDGAGNQSKTFTWADAGAGDYHIVTGDTFTGSDLSADAQFAFAVDIDGDARTSWYSGADEFVSGGGGGGGGGAYYMARRRRR